MSKYTKEEVHAAINSLPVSHEGRFIHIGMTVSFIGSLYSKIGSKAVITGPVRAISEGGRVHLAGPPLDGVHTYRDGIKGNECFLVHENAMKELEKQQQRVNTVA